MAHYAFLDDNNVVFMVIPGVEETSVVNGISDWEKFYSEQNGCKVLRTSYNTVNGQHLTGGIPYRGNYAGIGYSYDEVLDAFIPPKPYDSWNLNKKTCQWEPPVAYPEDGNDYEWNEEAVSWVEFSQTL
jgi:hypothetical protein